MASVPLSGPSPILSAPVLIPLWWMLLRHHCSFLPCTLSAAQAENPHAVGSGGPEGDSATHPLYQLLGSNKGDEDSRPLGKEIQPNVYITASVLVQLRNVGLSSEAGFQNSPVVS